MSSKKSKRGNTVRITSAPADLVEKSIDQAEVAYDTATAAVAERVEVLEAVSTTSSSGVLDFQKMAFEFANQNMDQAFAFSRKLFAVKEFGQALSLQQDFVSAQVETYKAQAGALNEIALRVSAEATKPLSQSLDKSFQTFTKSFAA